MAEEVAVRDPMVAEPPVIEEKMEEMAVKTEVKKEVVVAFVSTADPADRTPKFAEEEYKLVVVELVPVALTKVRFWSVVEPVSARLAKVAVPVAVMFEAVRLPSK